VAARHKSYSGKSVVVIEKECCNLIQIDKPTYMLSGPAGPVPEIYSLLSFTLVFSVFFVKL
jgi:hypothetical protein